MVDTNNINGASQKLPDFLNKEYLENVLKESERDPKITLTSFEYTLAAAEAGNNYVGLVLRFNLNYIQKNKKCSKKWIVKTTLPDPKMAQIVKDYGLFNKEMITYDRILGKFKKLLTHVGDKTILCPEAIKIDQENTTLIFEDLNEKGFCIANRKKGLDMKHTKIVMHYLAKYHACSMKLAEQKLENFKEFDSHMVDGKSEVGRTYFENMFATFCDSVKLFKGFEKYSEKLYKMKSYFFNEELELYKKPALIKVLIHGDCWVNIFVHTQILLTDTFFILMTKIRSTM